MLKLRRPSVALTTFTPGIKTHFLFDNPILVGHKVERAEDGLCTGNAHQYPLVCHCCCNAGGNDSPAIDVAFDVMVPLGLVIFFHCLYTAWW